MSAEINPIHNQITRKEKKKPINLQSLPLIGRTLYYQTSKEYSDQKLYDTFQIALELNMNVRRVQKWCKEGKFETARQVGKKKIWYVTVEEIDTLVLYSQNKQEI